MKITIELGAGHNALIRELERRNVGDVCFICGDELTEHHWNVQSARACLTCATKVVEKAARKHGAGSIIVVDNEM